MKPSIRRFLFFSILLIALVSCKEERKLKNYYPIGVGEVNWDTLYQTVPEFSMLNQQAETVTLDKRDDRIRVFHFYCGGCENSPAVFQQMTQLQQTYQEDTLVFLLSMSLTPSQDNEAVLQTLGKTYAADPQKWDILSGDSLLTRKTAESGFHLFFEEAETITKAPQILVLIDKEGKVRGKYKGMDEKEIAKLKEDIVVLKDEYIPKYDWWRFW